MIEDEKFSYAFSYDVHSNEADVFFTKYENLDPKASINLAEPMFYKDLNDKDSFVVLVFKKDYAFCAFFKKRTLLYLKALSLNDDIEKFIQSNYIKELCKEYASKIIFIQSDDKNMIKSLEPYFELEIKEIKQEYVNKLKNLDIKDSLNFTRDESSKDKSFLKFLAISFILSFLLVFFYPKLANFSFEKIDDKELEALKNELLQNEILLKNQEASVKELELNLLPFIFISDIKPIFELLDKYKIKLKSLKINGKELILSMKDSNDELIKELFENKDFVLKGKKIENGFLNIILELKDE